MIRTTRARATKMIEKQYFNICTHGKKCKARAIDACIKISNNYAVINYQKTRIFIFTKILRILKRSMFWTVPVEDKSSV